VPHRLKQPRRPRDLAGLDAVVEQPYKQLLHGAGADLQDSLECIGSAHQATVYGKPVRGQAGKAAVGRGLRIEPRDIMPNGRQDRA
jgi:hypothetical protein